jgi:FSR family fosmidomycin resistance protein-like MFS transporter
MKNYNAYLISLGHMVTDINQGALAALLPFLISEQSLSYTAAATLVFVANASSSLVQPVFGHFADKLSKPILMPIGIILAGAGLALTGFTDRYWILVVLAAVSGIGIAAFHPEGARTINRISGDNKATIMSIFSVGGNLGFAVGPAVLTAALLAFGMKGTAVLILPVSIVALWIWFRIPSLLQIQSASGKKASSSGSEKPKEQWMPFARLAGAVTCRAVIFYGLNTFIPLYWIYVLNQSKAAGATALTVMFTAGLFSTLLGGRLADRYGARRVMLVGYGSLIFTFPLFLLSNNVLVLTSLLIPMAFGIFAPFSPMIVLGQRFLPNRVGLASGVTLGLAISIGGVAAPLLGYVADAYGIRSALATLLVIPVIAALLSFSLPDDRRVQI